MDKTKQKYTIAVVGTIIVIAGVITNTELVTFGGMVLLIFGLL